jgi:hypothetical protein
MKSWHPSRPGQELKQKSKGEKERKHCITDTEDDESRKGKKGGGALGLEGSHGGIFGTKPDQGTL